MKKVLNLLLLTGTLANDADNQARLERMMRDQNPQAFVQSNADLEEASIARTLESEVAEDVSLNKKERKLSLQKKAAKLQEQSKIQFMAQQNATVAAQQIQSLEQFLRGLNNQRSRKSITTKKNHHHHRHNKTVNHAANAGSNTTMLIQADKSKKVHLDVDTNESVFASNIGSLLQNLQPQNEEDLAALAKVQAMISKQQMDNSTKALNASHKVQTNVTTNSNVNITINASTNATKNLSANNSLNATKNLTLNATKKVAEKAVTASNQTAKIEKTVIKAPAVEQQIPQEKVVKYEKSFVNKPSETSDKFVVPGFLYSQRNASANFSLVQGNITTNTTNNISSINTANTTHTVERKEHRPHFMSVEKQMELMNKGRQLDKMGSLTRIKAGDTQKNMGKIEELDKLQSLDSKENFSKFQKLQNKFDPTVVQNSNAMKIVSQDKDFQEIQKQAEKTLPKHKAAPAEKALVSSQSEINALEQNQQQAQIQTMSQVQVQSQQKSTAELELIETQVIKRKLDNSLVDMQIDVNNSRKKIDDDLKEMDMLE